MNTRTDQQIAKETSARMWPIPSVAMGAAITTVSVVGILLHFISDAFLTFVVALFLANIFMPMVERLRKRNVPMVFSILLVLGLVAAVLFGLVLVVITTVGSVTAVLPKYEVKWDQQFLPWISEMAGHLSLSLQQQVMNFHVSSVLQPDKLMGALTLLTSLVSSSALVLLFMLFILASNGTFREKLARAFPLSGTFHPSGMLNDIENRVRRYLVTTLVINLVAAVTMTVTLLLFGVDLALLWGVLTFLLMFIPSIGAIFAIITPLLLAFLQFDTLATPIILSAIVVVSQLFIGSYLSPRVVGSTLNLSPLLILVSIIFWGWVWGPLGMIVAVPITSTIAIIFESIPALEPLAILMSSAPKSVKPQIDLKLITARFKRT